MKNLSLCALTTLAAFGLTPLSTCTDNASNLLNQLASQNKICIASEQLGNEAACNNGGNYNISELLSGNCSISFICPNNSQTKATPTPTAVPQATKAPTPTAVPQATKAPKPTDVPQVTTVPKPTATPKPTASPVPTAIPIPTATPAPTATPVPTSVPSQKELSYAEQVVQLVNEERAKAGLSQLTINTNAAAAALTRAKETVTSFSHTRPSGKSFSTALTEAGVSFRGAGENIAWGQKTPQEVMTGWMNSSGHRANILNANYTAIGVGVYESGGRLYWVQLFIY